MSSRARKHKVVSTWHALDDNDEGEEEREHTY